MYPHIPVTFKPARVSSLNRIFFCSASVNSARLFTLVSHSSRYPKKSVSSHYMNINVWKEKCTTHANDRNKVYLQTGIITCSIGSKIRFPLPYTFFKMTSIHDVKKSVKVSDKSSCFDGIWVIIVLQSISYRFTKDLQVMENVNYNYNCIYNCTLPQTFIYKLP